MTTKKKRTRLPPPAHPRPAPRLETIREAAITLRLTEAALRARCRRAFATPDADGNAWVADGARAIKCGTHWRIEYV